MQYDFDEIIDRAGTNSIKFEAFRQGRPGLAPDAIPMWIADMDFACPPPVLAAMRRRLERRILGYSAVLDPAYGRAVAGWMERRFGWRADAEQLVTSSGIVAALHQCVALLTEPGDGVLMFTPTYAPFHMAAARQGRRSVFCRLLRGADGRFCIDFDALERLAARAGEPAAAAVQPAQPDRPRLDGAGAAARGRDLPCKRRVHRQR